MIGWILSVLLYLTTIFAGIIIDRKDMIKVKKIRRIYVCWLYVFLCFGYMTGSDWFYYESLYYDNDIIGSARYLTEPGSMLVFNIMPKIIPDFWLFTGLFKCIYLYVVIYFLSHITDKWLTAVALAIPVVLNTMLIQCPFRFMMAQMFVILALHIAFSNISNGRRIKKTKFIFNLLFLITLSSLFHNSCIFYFAIIPVLFFYKLVIRTPSWLIFIIYSIATVLSSDIGFITDLIGRFGTFSTLLDYSADYSPEDNSSFFSVGSILQIFFFILILLTRKSVSTNSVNGDILFGITVMYFIFARFLIIIPSGFRLGLPLSLFYVVYLCYILKYSYRIGFVFVLYLTLSFTNKLWTVYDLIPYSNSIPYIITGHKPYDERVRYNPEEFYKRTGERPKILDENII